MGIGFGELIWMGSISILLVVVYKGVLSIESKLDKLIAMQGWDEMADEAERKDGKDG